MQRTEESSAATPIPLNVSASGWRKQKNREYGSPPRTRWAHGKGERSTQLRSIAFRDRRRHVSELLSVGVTITVDGDAV